MYHAELKRKLRKLGNPKSNNDLQEKPVEAVNAISLDSIQRGSLRAYSRDAKGNVKENLIPDTLLVSDDEMSDDEDASDDLNIDSEEFQTDSDDSDY